MDRTFISHVERGVRNISIDNIERLAMALSLQTYQLLMPFDNADEIKLYPNMNATKVAIPLAHRR